MRRNAGQAFIKNMGSSRFYSGRNSSFYMKRTIFTPFFNWRTTQNFTPYELDIADHRRIFRSWFCVLPGKSKDSDRKCRLSMVWRGPRLPVHQYAVFCQGHTKPADRYGLLRMDGGRRCRDRPPWDAFLLGTPPLLGPPSFF